MFIYKLISIILIFVSLGIHFEQSFKTVFSVFQTVSGEIGKCAKM